MSVICDDRDPPWLNKKNKRLSRKTKYINYIAAVRERNVL